MKTTKSVIDSLEKDNEEAAVKMEDMRNTLVNLAKAEKSKVVEEELEKLKAKPEVEELKLDHWKRMIRVDEIDSNWAKEHKSKVATSQCLIETIQQQIQELKNVDEEKDNDIAIVVDNPEAMKDAIAKLRSREEVKIKQIQMVRRSERRPICMNPSRVV